MMTFLCVKTFSKYEPTGWFFGFCSSSSMTDTTVKREEKKLPIVQKIYDHKNLLLLISIKIKSISILTKKSLTNN
jgi:hypothetical protein